MAQEINEDKAKDLLKGVLIPPQPQILVDIQMEMAMPDFSLQNISQFIAKDVGLSGSLLKVVNSPYFGLSNKITSIDQAINLLGMKSVVNIIHTLEIRNSLNDDSIMALTGFWDNASDVAQACAVISKRVSFSAPDDAYTLGLFHNCGIPLMMQKFNGYAEILKQAYQQSEKRITDIENERLGSNHAVIGFYVAKSWQLPKNICNAIADHHKLDYVFSQKSGLTEHKMLLCILSIAAHLCLSHRYFGDTDQDHEFEKYKEDVLEYMGLTTLDLDDFKDDLIEVGILN